VKAPQSFETSVTICQSTQRSDMATSPWQSQSLQEYHIFSNLICTRI